MVERLVLTQEAALLHSGVESCHSSLTLLGCSSMAECLTLNQDVALLHSGVESCHPSFNGE